MDRRTRVLLQAIETLRPELPTLVGAEWPQFEAQLASLEEALRGQPADATVTRAQILALFDHYPQARARLVQLITAAGATPKDPGVGRGGGAPDGPRTVTRYTDITAPSRVWVGTTRVPVVVRLTVKPSSLSGRVEELSLRTDVPVKVHIQTGGFEVLNEATQEIDIPADADSRPVVFDLRPLKPGHTTIALDFFQGNELLRTTVLAVEITAYQVAEGAEPQPSGSLVFDARVPPPDLVLHIAWQPDPPALEFTLIRDGGASWVTYPKKELDGTVAEHANQLYGRIAKLLGQIDPTVKAVLQKQRVIAAEGVDLRIKMLGQSLWRDLVPDGLKDAYARERDAWRDRTLLVLSDEPHLPWELLWPYAAGEWEDEAPWCVTLRLTRWLHRDARGNGNQRPPASLRLAAMAVIAPDYALLPDLRGAHFESDVLAGMIQQHGLKDVSPAPPTWQAVVGLLERGGYDWFHAAAHGSFYPEHPDGYSALWLQEDEALAPEAIVGSGIEGHIKEQRPGFFFNACQTGRQGWAITRIGGWANALVSAGAGMFVGPHWEVSDGGALTFAQTFYRRLFQGETVADAMHAARLDARQTGDPTWLAYSVYAHPNARLLPGA